MRDPYSVLGVSKSATDAEIKRAFRALAKKHHPDQNPDDPKAKDRFAELNAAYEILGDAQKRKAFDAGEIDNEGKPRFRGFEGFGAGGPGAGGFSGFEGFGARAGFGGGRAGDPGDIFSELFGEAMRGARAGRSGGRPDKGEDVSYELKVSLEDIAADRRHRVKLPTGREIEVDLPKGVSDGQIIRLRGLGQAGRLGGAPGDALMTVRIAPHPRFTVDGSTLRTRVALALEDAVLGGRVRVPTLEGDVEASVPPMTSSGKSLRLKGKGLPGATGRGDIIATLEIVLPEEGRDDLVALMEKRRAVRSRT